jgi:type II secretory pathway pseudopilin PulG
VRGRGLTLVETLASFGLLLVAVLAALAVIPAAARGQAASALESQALYSAQEKMDDLLAARAFLGGGEFSDQPFPQDPSVRRRWWATPDPSGRADLQRIYVEVSWREQGRARKVLLVSTLAR